jgi:hypothetical protein
MSGRLALILAVGLAARAAPESRTARPKGTLPVIAGAVEVVHERIAGHPHVRYDVRESLPASRTIEQLVDAMAERGWTLAELGSLGEDAAWVEEPPLPGAFLSYWENWLRKSPTHQWEGRWRDANKREATFHLSYTCPLEQHGLHSVWVQVWGEVYGGQEADRRARERQRVSEKRQRFKDELCSAGGLKPSLCGK